MVFFINLSINCWLCNSLSERKVSAKYSVRTRPVKESSEERASIFLWTGASSISASSASRRAFASWSYTRDEWRMKKNILRRRRAFWSFQYCRYWAPMTSWAESCRTTLAALLTWCFLSETLLRLILLKDCRRDFLMLFTLDRGPSMASWSLGFRVHLQL